MSTGGLEPPQLSSHAPQACVSTIPPHRHGILLFYYTTINLSLVQYRRCAGCCFSNPLLGRYSIVLVGITPRIKHHRLQLVRIFITDIIVGLSPYRLMALLGLHQHRLVLIILSLLYLIFNLYFLLCCRFAFSDFFEY